MAKNKELIVFGFEHDPHDVAVAFSLIAKKRFGPDPFIGIKRKFFLEREPVTYITVKTGLKQSSKVAIGFMEIRGIKGLFHLEQSMVEAFVDKTEVQNVEIFLAEVKNHLETASLYKGKAVTSLRGFLDLSQINFDALVYNERVLGELNENLWVLIEKTEQCRNAGAPIQRKVLFEGKFGTGKTMALLYTAKKAVEHGFTFFYVEPTAPDISQAIEFMIRLTEKYKPTVLAIEDFDREQRLGDQFAMSRLMTAIDGVLSKDNETIIVLTTNFHDKIAGGFKRPGRIDKIINFNTFKADDAVSLLSKVIPANFLGRDIDWNKIGKASCVMTPAFIKEVGTGSVLAAISRAKDGALPKVTEEVLLNVIAGLQEQHKSCEAASHLGFQAS